MTNDGWLRAVDEALVVHHIGVADSTDSYEIAKHKLNQLLCCAQDIGAYFSTKDEALLRQALEALESCDAQHPSDGDRQWYDSKAVDATITALRERLGESND